MKKTELLNTEISQIVAEMGHTDQLTVCDCGFPIREARRIDLALKKGTPSFLEVLDTVLEELAVQKVILAEEIQTVSADFSAELLRHLPEGTAVEYVPHEQLKKMSESSRAVIRTGECTSYANIILESGVTF